MGAQEGGAAMDPKKGSHREKQEPSLSPSLNRRLDHLPTAQGLSQSTMQACPWLLTDLHVSSDPGASGSPSGAGMTTQRADIRGCTWK